MVRVDLRRIFRIAHVQEDLVETFIVVDTVGAYGWSMSVGGQAEKAGWEHTVDPWVSTDDSTLRKLKLGYCFLNTFIFKSTLLNHHNLFVVSITMDVRAKSNIALDLASGQIDYGLVKAILDIVRRLLGRTRTTYGIPDVVGHECFPINVRCLLATVFGLQVGQ